MSKVKSRYLALQALLISALFSNVSAQATPDRDAWISASLLGTTEAYESFLEYFPDSKYADQALESLVDSFETAAGGDTGGAGASGGGEGEGGQY